MQNSFDVQQQILQKRLLQAQQMRDQEFAPPQEQIVGGRYIKPDFGNALVQSLRAYNGMQESNKTEKDLADLQTKRTEGNNKALAEFLRQSQGAPGDAPLPEGQAGPVRPAQAPDMQGAYAALMQNPDTNQMGMQGAMSMAENQAKQMQAQQAQQRMMMALQSAKTPQEALASGVPSDVVKNYYESGNWGKSKVQFKDTGGSLVPVDDYGNTPQGVQPISKTGNPFSDLILADGSGGFTQNAPLVNAKTGIARAGKPVVNVDARNFNTQEGEQSKAYGKTLGEMRGVITQAGFDAPKKIAQLDRMEQLIGGLDAGGKAAPMAADVASYAQSMGIKLDPKLGAKEAAQALAVEMAGNMRAPGTGPMTDKDFDNFLKRVPDLSKTPEGRKQITGTMRAALQRDLEASKFARDYAKANGGVIDDNFYDSLSDFYVKNPVVTPQLPATNARGNRIFEDADAILSRGKK